MSKSEEFITLINEFKTVSPTISDEQRKGLLRRAVQQYDLSVDDATNILNGSGLIIGEEINYFEVLNLSVTEFESQSESEIVNAVESAHKRLYSASLMAGGRPRADGRTEEQWRIILNQAKDILADPQKRHGYLATLVDVKTSKDLGNVGSFIDTSSAPLSLDNMVLIPEGEFEMGGSDNEAFADEKPVHTVYVEEFYMDKYPVTNAEFKEFVDANPQWSQPRWLMKFLPTKYHDGYYLDYWKENNFPQEKINHPVVHISWYAAMAYAEWVGKRLPTEAEWEKAARGGLIGQKYSWGNVIDPQYANYGNNVGSTTPVGEYAANELDLYDMSGNVWEWCLDEWDDRFYYSSPHANPVSGDSIPRILGNYTDSKGMRMMRGGSWYNTVQNVRVAKRSAALPTYTNSNIGFRCAMSIT